MRDTFTCIRELLVISAIPLRQEHRDLPIKRREEAIAIVFETALQKVLK